MSRHKKRKDNGIRFSAELMRPQRAGLSDLSERLPFYSILNRKKIALAGLGCVGAPMVLELARSGIGEIKLLDCDAIDVGTIVRWPFGMSQAGNLKTVSIANFIRANYPYTTVVPFNLRLGAAEERGAGENDLEIMDQFLEGTELLLDASADLNVNHLLSDLSKERETPYIAVSTTYGAWGGQVVRIRPNLTAGCWFCYRHSLENGAIPYANSDPQGEIQPGGCGTPTYTGAGFDAQEISLAGVRMSISTLTAGDINGYPTMDWDVAIVNLRSGSGEAIPPQWHTFHLEKHPLCHCR
jgi:molybdopterin/thiamine biosynthesis adenylyltransferase